MKAALRSALGWTQRLARLLIIVAATLLIARIVQTRSGPRLEPWHTFIPAEPDAAVIDRLDWIGYLTAENRIMESIRVEVTERLKERDRTPSDRYFAASPVYPGRFAQDWNRSYVLEPDGPPKGAAVFLHGLTDSPYSLRHIAQRYRDRGSSRLDCALPAMARCRLR
jgi:hypothetical protein